MGKGFRGRPAVGNPKEPGGICICRRADFSKRVGCDEIDEVKLIYRDREIIQYCETTKLNKTVIPLIQYIDDFGLQIGEFFRFPFGH